MVFTNFICATPVTYIIASIIIFCLFSKCLFTIIMIFCDQNYYSKIFQFAKLNNVICNNVWLNIKNNSMYYSKLDFCIISSIIIVSTFAFDIPDFAQKPITKTNITINTYHACSASRGNTFHHWSFTGFHRHRGWHGDQKNCDNTINVPVKPN